MKDIKSKLLWGLLILIWSLGIPCLYKLFCAIPLSVTTFEYVAYMIATFIVVLGLVSSLKCVIILRKDEKE